MNLHCESCNDNHAITNGDVERIVYALEAEAREDPGKTRPGPDEPTCLLAILDLAVDAEGYAEHTTNMIERRLLRENGRRRGVPTG